jgi:hypothetical protein
VILAPRAESSLAILVSRVESPYKKRMSGNYVQISGNLQYSGRQDIMNFREISRKA